MVDDIVLSTASVVTVGYFGAH